MQVAAGATRFPSTVYRVYSRLLSKTKKGAPFATADRSGRQLNFERHGGREVAASFDGSTMSSGGSAPLLAQVDRRLRLIDWLAVCFLEERNPLPVTHKVRELLVQRVFALALGYSMLRYHLLSYF